MNHESNRQKRFKRCIREDEQADKDRNQIHTDIKFIKENLFNPHEGLWAETKDNTRFRKDSQKWRGVIGIGFIGLIIDKVWSVFS